MQTEAAYVWMQAMLYQQSYARLRCQVGGGRHQDLPRNKFQMVPQEPVEIQILCTQLQESYYLEAILLVTSKMKGLLLGVR